MKKQKNLTRMLGIAMLATMFGTGMAYAQATSGGDAASKDASGKTSQNRAGQMSPTGQNETTSTKPMTSGASGTAGSSSMTSGASGTAGSSSSGASSMPDSGTKDAAGKTSENRAGRMSATGENETTSTKPKKMHRSERHSSSGASGTSGTSGASNSTGTSTSTSRSGNTSSPRVPEPGK